MAVLEMEAMYTEEVTPEEFLKIYEQEKQDIRSATVVPSRLGDRNFGKIIVERKTPVYVRKAQVAGRKKA